MRETERVSDDARYCFIIDRRGDLLCQVKERFGELVIRDNALTGKYGEGGDRAGAEREGLREGGDGHESCGEGWLVLEGPAMRAAEKGKLDGSGQRTQSGPQSWYGWIRGRDLFIPLTWIGRFTTRDCVLRELETGQTATLDLFHTLLAVKDCSAGALQRL